MKFSTLAFLPLLVSGSGNVRSLATKKAVKNAGGGKVKPTRAPTAKVVVKTEAPVAPKPIKKGVCVIGCTPYVNPEDPNGGIRKYEALVEDMAQNCEILVHVGDTKAGGAVCNKDLMTGPLKTMAAAAAIHGTMALYAPGDNELNDCHRDGSQEAVRAADFYKAADARAFLIEDMAINSGKDLTGNYDVEQHTLVGTIPGTRSPYSCDFDKYVETETYAVATLEVMGSYWYLEDASKKGRYINQDKVDPLAGRLGMYLNAKDCALDWIRQSAAKASSKGLRAVFYTMQAAFWGRSQFGPVNGPLLGGSSIGEYYNATNLANITKGLTGTAISEPFQPLYDELTKTAFAYPDIMFYVLHADSHFWDEIRMSSTVNNNGTNTFTHQNLMILQVEGDSRALSMYAQVSVNPTKFQPVDAEQVWSEAAYMEVPYGHNYYKFA